MFEKIIEEELKASASCYEHDEDGNEKLNILDNAFSEVAKAISDKIGCKVIADFDAVDLKKYPPNKRGKIIGHFISLLSDIIIKSEIRIQILIKEVERDGD